ncbi:hypothetical protein D3C83_11990 [compost metagenome]
MRVALVMPIARTRPAFTCGNPVCGGAKISCTWPAMTSISAGPPPLYGTCDIFTPAMYRNSSVERCTMVPWPLLP